MILTLLTALLGAGTVFFALLALRARRTPALSFAEYTGDLVDQPLDASRIEKVGALLAGRSTTLAARLQMAHHRRWLELVEDPSSPEYLLGLSFLLGGGGLALMLLSGIPAVGCLALLGALYPFVRLRSRANRVRRQVQRSLPDLAALIAAEMAANNPPDKALRRAAEWGGPLAALLRHILQAAQMSQQPLFGRDRTEGVLLQAVDQYDLPSVQAFARQIDLAARTGVAGPEQMERLAHTLIVEFKDRALREAEKLDSKLAVPAVMFFFLPFLFLLLTPMLWPLLEAL